MKTAPKTIRCRNYRRYDHNGLKNADWSPVYISHSISDSLQAFNRILTEFFDQQAPFATKRTNTNISAWLTVELKNEMDYKDAFQRKFRKSKTTENYEKYKLQRNKVNNLVKRAKQNYSKNLQDENTKNTTSFWKTLKHFSPNRNQNLLARHSK